MRYVIVSLGKRLTRAQAKVLALMESLEDFHAEEIRLPIVRDTVRQSRSWEVIERYPGVTV